MAVTFLICDGDNYDNSGGDGYGDGDYGNRYGYGNSNGGGYGEGRNNGGGEHAPLWLTPGFGLDIASDAVLNCLKEIRWP